MSNDGSAYRATQDRRSPLVPENRSRSYRTDRSQIKIPVSLSVVKRISITIRPCFQTVLTPATVEHTRARSDHFQSFTSRHFHNIFFLPVQFPNTFCDRFQMCSRTFNVHDNLLFPSKNTPLLLKLHLLRTSSSSFLLSKKGRSFCL